MSRQTPCVLVVEDEGAQRAVLQYNLEAEGFDVVVADNGEDALLLAMTLVRPDMAPILAGLAEDFGLALRRMTSRTAAGTPRKAGPNINRTLH